MLGLKNFNVTLSKFGWLQKMILYPVLNSEVLFHILKNVPGRVCIYILCC